MEYLELIDMKKRKKSKFIRQEATFVKRLGKKWRRAKGNQSKQRLKKKGKAKMPSPGYRSSRKIRGLHPSGFQEVLVFSINDLEGLDPNKHACRIGSTVGKKKRFEIMKKASEIKLKILNPTRIKEEIK